MIDYFKGIIFLVLFVLLMSCIGKRVRKSHLFCENFIYGYAIYTAGQFFGGFLCQLFRMPWILFQCYMVLWLLFLLALCLYKNSIKIEKKKVIEHFKQYGILYFLALIFVILSCMNLSFQWSGNYIDDGYYLLKIRMAPYVGNYTDYIYATGFNSAESLNRILNTFEIEGAFYAQLLQMDAAIYAKVFLSAINYIVFLTSIYWLYAVVLVEKNKHKWLSFALVPILVLGIFAEDLAKYGVLNLSDLWQFNTAMWYGSTLVKSAGFFLLIPPFLTIKKFDYKAILFFILMSITLMSKAGQALPVIVVSAVSIVVLWLLDHYRGRKNIVFPLILGCTVLLLLPINESIKPCLVVINECFTSNFTLPIVISSLILVIISLRFPFPVLRKWNLCLLVMGVLIFVPRMNTLYASLCIYNFVAARIASLYVLSLLVTGMLVLYLILIKMVKSSKAIVLIYLLICIFLTGVPLINIRHGYGNKNTLSVLFSNNKLIPESTLALSSRLKRLKDERNSELYVVMSMAPLIENIPHAVAPFIRYNAFDIYSIGSIPRYGWNGADTAFASYSQEDQDVVERYNSGEDVDDLKMKEVLERYPINCVVLYVNYVADHFETTFDFELVDTIKLDGDSRSYYIFYKDK